MKYCDTLYGYFKRCLKESSWQKPIFILFWVMLGLLIWSNIEAWYIPSCFSKKTSDNINAVIENISCSYIVSYFTYVATTLIPTLVRMRQHRVMLAENTRRLYDSASTFYEQLFQVGYEKEEIDKPDYNALYNYYCWCVTEKYQLKECNHKVITDNEQYILQYQKVIESGYEDLFSSEREILSDLQLAEMWKMIEQLKCQQYLFPCEKWEKFSNEIVHYLRLAKRIRESLNGEKPTHKRIIDTSEKSLHGVNINLFNINNSFNQ